MLPRAHFSEAARAAGRAAIARQQAARQVQLPVTAIQNVPQASQPVTNTANAVPQIATNTRPSVARFAPSSILSQIQARGIGARTVPADNSTSILSQVQANGITALGALEPAQVPAPAPAQLEPMPRSILKKTKGSTTQTLVPNSQAPLHNQHALRRIERKISITQGILDRLPADESAAPAMPDLGALPHSLDNAQLNLTHFRGSREHYQFYRSRKEALLAQLTNERDMLRRHIVVDQPVNATRRRVRFTGEDPAPSPPPISQEMELIRQSPDFARATLLSLGLDFTNLSDAEVQNLAEAQLSPSPADSMEPDLARATLLSLGIDISGLSDQQAIEQARNLPEPAQASGASASRSVSMSAAEARHLMANKGLDSSMLSDDEAVSVATALSVNDE